MNADAKARLTGTIFNIQRFSLHDGPGIRSTVFMKGCPLRCKWCSNPESINPDFEIMTYDMRCIGCGRCIEVCPKNAIDLDGGLRRINRSKCNLCMECVKECPSGAIEQAGWPISVEELVHEIAQDIQFYLDSGGGVTLSGGEPLLQREFTMEVLRHYKQRGIDTALDTSGAVRWDLMERVLEYTDLVLFDIKHMDPAYHKKGTGMDNTLILDNVEKTARKVRTWIRVPVIPDYNDSEANTRKLAEFCTKLTVEKVSLLPYHHWGEQKYQRMGKEYSFKNVPKVKDEKIRALQKIIESYGLEVTIGS